MKTALNRDFKNLPIWVWGVLAVSALALWLLAARLDLSFDEAYYWTWAQHASLSYYDHPPMVAWLIALSTAVFGDSEFAVRFFAPLCLIVTCVSISGAVRDFGGDRRASIIAALLPLCTIAGPASGLIITPDTPLLAASALVLRVVAAFYRSGNPNWWLAIGFAGGVALLSKYAAVALGVGILIWLVTSRQRLHHFRCWQVWAGAVLALLVFSPVLLWNAEHEWASFAKQGGRAFGDYAFSFKTAVEFAFSQIGLLTPFIAALAIYCCAVAVKSARLGSSRDILFCALSLPFLAYIFLTSFGMKVEANWTLVSFPALVAVVTLVSSEHWDNLKRFTLIALGFGATLAALVVIYLATPLKHELGRRDPTQRLSGNAALGKNVGKLAQQYQACMILTQDYANTALLSYYLRGSFDVLQMNEPMRTTGWSLPDRNACAGKKVLLVTSKRLQPEPAASPYFTDMQRVAMARRAHRGTIVEIYDVYTAKLALIP